MALFVTLVLPAALAFWLVIHGGIRIWRSTGLATAYLASAGGISLVMFPVWHYQGWLIGLDLGFNWLTVIPGALIYLATIFLSKPIRNHLSLRTFAGIPEIENEATNLLLEGPYSVVRHPRYTMVIAGIFGWCLVCNFSGTYILGLSATFGFYIITVLEERELLSRFGDSYFDYQHRVPRLIPSARGIFRLYQMRNESPAPIK